MVHARPPPLRSHPLAALLAVLPLIVGAPRAATTWIPPPQLLEVSPSGNKASSSLTGVHCGVGLRRASLHLLPALSWIIGAALGFLPWIAVRRSSFGCLDGIRLHMHRLTVNGLLQATLSSRRVSTWFTLHALHFLRTRSLCELLAAAWIPLLLLGILHPRLTVSGIAVPICLLCFRMTRQP